MKIVLLGYMGSGKSVVGKQLAVTLDLPYVDLDKSIEEDQGKSINELFQSKGEIYFRKIENQLLHRIIDGPGRLILSTGGGTPCYGDNLPYMNSRPDVLTVYLKTSIPTLVARLRPEKDHRPLISHLGSEDELMEFIGKHLFERNPFYNQADLIIETDGRVVNEIVQEIVLNLF